MTIESPTMALIDTVKAGKDSLKMQSQRYGLYVWYKT